MTSSISLDLIEMSMRDGPTPVDRVKTHSIRRVP
jgi:hypothetical protein